MENMGEFFDRRSETYDSHMKETVVSYERFYSYIAAGISNTQDHVKILDIGCGTGLEFQEIFERAPNAHITGIGLSGEMLNRLRAKYEKRLNQITLIQKSYLTLPLGKDVYDYIVSVMTLHHLLPDSKRKLYQRFKKALRPNGKYIEGDYIVTPEKEKQFLNNYYELCRSNQDIKDGTHHVDIPFSLDTQKRILTEAGFSEVEVLWLQGETAVYAASC